MNIMKIISSIIVTILLLLIGACSTPPPSESVVANDIRNYVETLGYGEIIDINKQGDGKLSEQKARKMAGYEVVFRYAVKLPAGFYAAYHNNRIPLRRGISRNVKEICLSSGGLCMESQDWRYPELPEGTIYVMEERIEYWNINNGGWMTDVSGMGIIPLRGGVCPTAKSASECYLIQKWD